MSDSQIPWTAARQAPPSFTISRSLLKLMSIESVMPSYRLILCCPLLLLPSIFPSIRVFSSELALHIRWPKYWNFSFNTSPSNAYSGLISFRIDWFDLLLSKGLSRVFSSCLIIDCLFSISWVMRRLSHSASSTLGFRDKHSARLLYPSPLSMIFCPQGDITSRQTQ